MIIHDDTFLMTWLEIRMWISNQQGVGPGAVSHGTARHAHAILFDKDKRAFKEKHAMAPKARARDEAQARRIRVGDGRTPVSAWRPLRRGILPRACA